jgi:quercetin 2,3-dioxygenase
LIDLRMDPGAVFDAPIPGGQRAFAHVLEGQTALGAEKQLANAGDVAWAVPSSGGDGDDALAVRAASVSRALLFASPIIDEPIVMGGPFVMNTREEILEAFADLRAGRLIRSGIGGAPTSGRPGT